MQKSLKIKFNYAQHGLKKTGPGLQFDSGCNFKKYPRTQTEVQANAQLFFTLSVVWHLKERASMIINDDKKIEKQYQLLRIFSLGLLLIILTSILINVIDPRIEFSDPHFNRFFWGFVICYIVIVFYLITLLIIKSYHKILRWIIWIGILPLGT